MTVKDEKTRHRHAGKFAVIKIPHFITLNGKEYRRSSVDNNWGRLSLDYISEDYDAVEWHKHRDFNIRYTNEENCSGCALFGGEALCECQYLKKSRAYKEAQRILDERMEKLYYKESK